MKQLLKPVSDKYFTWCHRVKVRLASYGRSQKDLAFYLGIDPSNVSKYLSGVIEPGLSFYFRVEYYIYLLEIDYHG